MSNSIWVAQINLSEIKTNGTFQTSQTELQQGNFILYENDRDLLIELAIQHLRLEHGHTIEADSGPTI